jgi:uncharacterized protein YndB with AHSA1/START domain
MRRTLIAIALSLLALIAGLGAWGATLPREHTVRAQIALAVPPESVYTVMRDIGALPAWWHDVEKVEAVTGTDGYERWKETSDGMAFTLIINTEEPPLRFTTRIDTTGNPGFGGMWTHEVALASGGGTTVTITEEGWVANPYFRVMMKLGGPTRTIDSYLTALGSRFGASVTPAHLTP